MSRTLAGVSPAMFRLLAFLAVLIPLSSPALAEVVIVVHPGLALAQLDERELKEIFLGKRVKWEDNSPVKAAVLDDETLHGQFLETYINRTPSQWNTYWKRMIFTGGSPPPHHFKTSAELGAYVAATPGAIGYVEGGSIPSGVTPVTVK